MQAAYITWNQHISGEIDRFQCATDTFQAATDRFQAETASKKPLLLGDGGQIWFIGLLDAFVLVKPESANVKFE
jgi:hypothetical protein